MLIFVFSFNACTTSEKQVNEITTETITTISASSSTVTQEVETTKIEETTAETTSIATTTTERETTEETTAKEKETTTQTTVEETTATETTTAIEETTAQQQTGSIQIASLTSPISRGADATISILTSPNALCSIVVYYKSGPSKAKGLDPKTSDANGNCSWTWKVGTNTTPGDWRIVITVDGIGSIEAYFTVTG